MKVCVITDNLYIYEHFIDLLRRKPQDAEFDFFYATWNHAFREKFGENGGMKPIKLREQGDDFFNAYDLFISLHCKQLFPDKMVTEHTCINVHPGLNPYNRGWFPQVFGIMNHMPIGVTIHKMDTELDHGPILYQRELTLGAGETSKDVYERILATEMELMEEHLEDILTGNYTLTPMAGEGNINYKQDFDALCEIDRDKPATYGEVIDFLRAMTHQPYKNAYFPVVFDGAKYTRDEAAERLAAQGINARKYFFPLTNHNEAYGFYGEQTPIALHVSERVLTLPLYPDLAPDDVDRICDLITN